MKIEFPKPEDLVTWLRGKESKYEIYIVNSPKEIVAMPLKSTRPVKIGTAQWFGAQKEVQEKIKEELNNIEIYAVETLDFQIER